MSKGSSIGIKNFAILYPGLFITGRMGQNFSKLSTAGLWILGLP